jgi:hypothetical protein
MATVKEMYTVDSIPAFGDVREQDLPEDEPVASFSLSGRVAVPKS